MAKIILHADDFGYDTDTTLATIECFERGALTSATIMATCKCAPMAIEYAKEHPEFSFGAHLTFVDGLQPAVQCESLLVDGVFEQSNITRKKSIVFKHKTQDIVDEIKAQMKIIEDGGVILSHLDSHGHLHKFPSFLRALKQIKKTIPKLKVRRSQNLFINSQRFGPVKVLNMLFDWYIVHNFKTTDAFYMSANSMDTNWAKSVLNMIDELPDNATVEVGVHPGHCEDWRQHEYDDIFEFATLVRKSKHKIITWKEV